MKTLITVIAACLISLQLVGQQVVNMELTSQTNTNCQVTLYPSAAETSVLSNVVFTLKWRSSRNIAFNNPSANSLITISKSGPVRTDGGWKYQTFSGVGLQVGAINQPIVINIPRSGRGVISISSDPFVEQQSVNGRYFVSIGGRDVTGDLISSAKSLTIVEDVQDESESVILYFDPLSRQFYVKRLNEYYNLVGQRVIITNQAELVVVRKTALQ
jgi:hypothetical protein